MESIESNISFIIYGDINENEIEKFNELQKYGEVRFRKKGDIISCALPAVERDMVSFTYKLSEQMEELNFFCKIVESLNISKYKQKGYKVCLRLYIQSDYAQIQFCLPNKILQMIEKLKLDLDISILSWGGID